MVIRNKPTDLSTEVVSNYCRLVSHAVVLIKYLKHSPLGFHMTRQATATINLAALTHNFSRVKHYCPGEKIMAMVKANAYGHGIIETAKALHQADGFGVACISEAVALRHANIQQPIFLVSGFHSREQIPLLLQHHLTPILHSPWQVAALQDYVPKRPLNVWLKYDTGMHRLGFSEAELDAAIATFADMPMIDVTGFASHLACAGEPDLPAASAATELQIQRFNEKAKALGLPASLANSAGIVAWPSAHTYTDWVRPGIMLYGASPITGRAAADFGLKPVMSLTCEVISVKKVAKGEHVGYGATWYAKKDSLVAVISMGYGDGYPRDIQKGYVSVHQTLCPIIGRVSMDMMSVDVSALAEVQPGDSAQLWGPVLPVDQVAADTGCFYYQLLTQITMRVVKKYIE